MKFPACFATCPAIPSKLPLRETKVPNNLKQSEIRLFVEKREFLSADSVHLSDIARIKVLGMICAKKKRVCGFSHLICRAINYNLYNYSENQKNCGINVVFVLSFYCKNVTKFLVCCCCNRYTSQNLGTFLNCLVANYKLLKIRCIITRKILMSTEVLVVFQLSLEFNTFNKYHPPPQQISSSPSTNIILPLHKYHPPPPQKYHSPPPQITNSFNRYLFLVSAGLGVGGR